MTNEEFELHERYARVRGRLQGVAEVALEHLLGNSMVSKETVIWALRRALRYDGTDESLEEKP